MQDDPEWSGSRRRAARGADTRRSSVSDFVAEAPDFVLDGANRHAEYFRHSVSIEPMLAERLQDEVALDVVEYMSIQACGMAWG